MLYEVYGKCGRATIYTFNHFNLSIFQLFNISIFHKYEAKRFSKDVFPRYERRRSRPLVAQVDRGMSATDVRPRRTVDALQEVPHPQCEASKNHHGVSRRPVSP